MNKIRICLVIDISIKSNGNVIKWRPWDPSDDKPTLVPMNVWCRQTTIRELNQCGSSSITSYGVTRFQWVRTCRPDHNESWRFCSRYFQTHFIEWELLEISRKLISSVLIDMRIACRRQSQPKFYDVTKQCLVYIYIYINYPLFASADTGIYQHAASQCRARPKAKRGMTMLSLDKFPYQRK